MGWHASPPGLWRTEPPSRELQQPDEVRRVARDRTVRTVAVRPRCEEAVDVRLEGLQREVHQRVVDVPVGTDRAGEVPACSTRSPTRKPRNSAPLIGPNGCSTLLVGAPGSPNAADWASALSRASSTGSPSNPASRAAVNASSGVAPDRRSTGNRLPPMTWSARSRTAHPSHADARPRAPGGTASSCRAYAGVTPSSTSTASGELHGTSVPHCACTAGSDPSVGAGACAAHDRRRS